MRTTLNRIRSYDPCADGWRKLLTHLGKTGPDDDPLPLTAILDSNGLDDALWALRAVEGHDREKRLFAVSCVRQVEHLMTDQRARDALDVAERFARGRATRQELDAAAVRAADAAAAAYPADAAAYATVHAVVHAAAYITAAAYVTVYAVVHAAADVAYITAADAAYAAARSAQSAEFRRVCEAIEAGTDPYPDTLCKNS